MQKELKKRELLNGLQSAEEGAQNKEVSGNSELIKRDKIAGTPFTCIRIEKETGEYEYFATFGRIRVTDAFDEEVKVHDAVQGFDWDVVLAVVIQVATDVVVETIRGMASVKSTDKRAIDDISTGGSKDLEKKFESDAGA